MEGFAINWKILLGQAVNFLILFFLMKRFVFPRFFSILKERERRIEEGIKKAQLIEEKSKMLEVEREKVLKEAKKEAELILKEAKERAEEKEKEILERAKKEKEKIIKEAREMGKEEIEKMKKDFLERNVEMVLALAEKFLAKKLDPKEDKRIILKLLRELEKDEK